MLHTSLDGFDTPTGIAIIGATDKMIEGTGGAEPRPKVGRAITENALNCRREGITPPLYLINRKSDSYPQGLFDQPVYSSLQELELKTGSVPSHAVICVPARAVAGAIREAKAIGVQFFVIITAGFAEAGQSAAHLQNELLTVLEEEPRCPTFGPNTLGVMFPHLHLNLSFGPELPEPGTGHLLMQSGAYADSAISLWDDIVSSGIGARMILNLGNQAMITDADVLGWWADKCEQDDFVLMYSEGFKNPVATLEAVAALSRKFVPVIEWRAGKTEAGGEATAAHTDSVSQIGNFTELALMRQGGLLPAESLEMALGLVNVATLNPPPKSNAMEIVTNGGGPGAGATDARSFAAEQGYPTKMIPVPENLVEELKHLIPVPAANPNYPFGCIDVIGDASSNRYYKAGKFVFEQMQIPAALFIVTPQAMTNVDEVCSKLVQLRQEHPEAVMLVCLAGGHTLDTGRKILAEGGVAEVSRPDEAVKILARFLQLSKFYHLLESSRCEIGAGVRLLGIESQAPVLVEAGAVALLDAGGIESPRHKICLTALQASRFAVDLGRPVVLKIVAPDSSAGLHKSNIGGIILNVHPQNVAEQFEKLSARMLELDVPLAGILVAEYLPGFREPELVVRVKRISDGLEVCFGEGGYFVELRKDFALGYHATDSMSSICLNREFLREMVESLTVYRVFEGFRGGGPIDVGPLLDATLQLLGLFEANPEIQSVEINPFLASKGLALDADVRLQE